MLLLSAVFVGVVLVGVKSDPQQDFPYHAQLSPDFTLYWSFNSTHITFNTVVNTSGYVGFGISRNGNMWPADVVVGGVKDGVAHLQDSHTTGNTAPVPDTHQDWHLMSGTQVAGVTSLTFYRRLDTCDDQDLAILEGTTRVIYAYGPTDTVAYHGPQQRGAKSLLLLDPPSYESKNHPLPHNVETLDFLNGNFSMPGKDTFYHCKGFQLPTFSGKRHMIKYEPIITPGNEKLVHHIILSYCPGHIDPAMDGRGFDCYKGKPQQLLNCFSVMVAWAIGGQAFEFPDNVGFPLGSAGDPTFWVMETHYDNPGLRSDYIDNSGIRLTLTSEIRQYDAGVMQVGANTERHQIVPPYTKQMVSTGYCSPDCLGESIGEGGEIRVFANLLHSHLLGYGIKTRVVRQGTELVPLAQDNNYDFNFQESRRLPDELVLKKGDSLIVECTYKGPHRNFTTYGGLRTIDEMCLSFPMFYPKTNLSLCTSELQYEVHETPGHDNFWDWVEAQDWTQQATHDMFQQLTDVTPVKMACYGPVDYTDWQHVKFFDGQYKVYNQTDLQPKVKYVPPKVCP